MIITKKRWELLESGKLSCYFCGKTLKPEEIDVIDYVNTSDGKETLYLHKRCFTERYFDVFGKEGAAK